MKRQRKPWSGIFRAGGAGPPIEAMIALWVADFIYCWTWSGFVYVAFVTDVFARRIVGWRVSASMKTGFVLDALNQALNDREPPPGLIHHSLTGAWQAPEFAVQDQHWRGHGSIGA